MMARRRPPLTPEPGSQTGARHPEPLARTGTPRPRRGERIAEAKDEETRARLIEAARKRREERIRKAAERDRKRKDEKRERRRRKIAERHLPEGHPLDWTSPATRKMLDDALTDPRDRALFGLPPLPRVEIGGMRRILAHRRSAK